MKTALLKTSKTSRIVLPQVLWRNSAAFHMYFNLAPKAHLLSLLMTGRVLVLLVLLIRLGNSGDSRPIYIIENAVG